MEIKTFVSLDRDEIKEAISQYLSEKRYETKNIEIFTPLGVRVEVKTLDGK